VYFWSSQEESRIQGVSMRGIKGAKIEFNLACIASNLRRMWNFLNGFSGIKC